MWTKILVQRKNPPTILGCTHRWFSSNTGRTGRGEKTDWYPLGSKSAHHHTVREPQEKSDCVGRNEEWHPISSGRLHQRAVFGSKKTKQFTKTCEEWKQKLIGNRSTEAQARAYFKAVYGIFDAERDSFHEIGVANNAVMQGKLDEAAAEMAQMKQQLAAQ